MTVLVDEESYDAEKHAEMLLKMFGIDEPEADRRDLSVVMLANGETRSISSPACARSSVHAEARSVCESVCRSVVSERSGTIRILSSDDDLSPAWPAMGFDALLPDAVRSALPPSLDYASSVLDLHATSEGRRWWASNGCPVEYSIDLASEPQVRVLRRFVEHFVRTPREYAAAAGCGAISPADMLRLDDVWAAVEECGDLDDYEPRSADCGRDEGGKFAPKNECQEEGEQKQDDATPIGKSTFEQASLSRAKSRAEKSISAGDVRAATKHIAVMLESSKPSDVAKWLGFENFDAKGALDDSVSEKPSLKKSVTDWWRGKSASDFAAGHLAKLAVASRFVPELKQQSFEVMTHGDFVSSVLDEAGVTGFAARAVARLNLWGVMAACNLKNGEITLLRDRDGEGFFAKMIAESGHFSTTHPSHAVVHEYAHTLQHNAIKSNAKDDSEESIVESVVEYQELAAETARRFVADDSIRDDFLNSIVKVSGYATTSPLELAAEYWTAVTLGFKENMPVLDKYLEGIQMPVPKRRKVSQDISRRSFQ